VIAIVDSEVMTIKNPAKFGTGDRHELGTGDRHELGTPDRDRLGMKSRAALDINKAI
jgi:hypothetical protein